MKYIDLFGSLYRDFGSNAIEDDVAPINVVAVLKALSVRHIGTCGGVSSSITVLPEYT